VKKFFVVEVGSTHTKCFLYDNGRIDALPHRSSSELYSIVRDLKKQSPNIFVYGTSRYRKMSDKEQKDFKHDFKAQTGIDFNIVTAEQEAEYTAMGVTLGNDFKGRLCIMIGGGGSTEVVIIENKQIIERHFNDVGTNSINQKFPQLNDFKPRLTLNQLDDFTFSKIQDIQKKADILVVAGGDTIYGYQSFAKEFLKPNQFYNDETQPVYITTSNAIQAETNFTFERDLVEHQKLYSEYSYNWWTGARAWHSCIRAIAKKSNAEYIIPTKINMCLGIIKGLV